MATTMRDITKKKSRHHTSPPVQGQAVPPADLPLDTCGACEATTFGAFEGAAGGDEGLYKSPDRRSHEQNGTSQPPTFRCRSCGKTVHGLPDNVDAQVTVT